MLSDILLDGSMIKTDIDFVSSNMEQKNKKKIEYVTLTII